MVDRRPQLDSKKVDPKEFEFPETVFIRDIENRVFQGIVLQVLSQIEGISLVEGTFIDNLLGRNAVESIKGIHAEQNTQNHTISIKVEINVCYGISIAEKASEIQTQITSAITQYTGLHVAAVHVIFKNLICESPHKHMISPFPTDFAPAKTNNQSEDYTEEF